MSVSIYNRFRVQRAGQGDGTAPRCLDALTFASANKTKWAFIIAALGGTLASIGGVLGATYGSAPDTVSATATWDASSGTVIVTWTWPTPMSFRSTLVTLTDIVDPTKTFVATVPGSVASHAFTGVAVGTYIVTVRNIMPGEAGPAHATMVTVAKAAAPTATTKPNAPAAATLAIVTDTTTGLRSILASWTAALTPPEVTSYKLTITSTVTVNGAPMTTSTSIADVRTTERALSGLVAGTYSISVTAVNTAGESAAATSTAMVFTPTTAGAPGAPRNLRLVAYRSDATKKPGILVRWEPPADALGTIRYLVSFALGTPLEQLQDTGSSTSTTFADLADGTYLVTVTPRNETGTGTAASDTVKVTIASIPADSVDWGAFFDPDQIAAWKATNDPFPALDEATFWAAVRAAVADTTNAHGGTASFAEQLTLARVLAAWVEHPAALPTIADSEAMAKRLAALTTPPFPLLPTTPWAPYANRLALWDAAPKLRNAMNTVAEPVRYKLFAIIRALELHLASSPDHVRLYDSTVVPPETTMLSPQYAIETAQRFAFAAAGTIPGVWWYRVGADTGVNTVTVWRAGTAVGEAAADLGAATGWVYLALRTPVRVTAGDSLLVGVHHPNAAYGTRANGFTSRTLAQGPLTSPAAVAASPNGLYEYVAKPTLPTLSYLDSEYFISPDFVPS